jgi:hypothetical protein
MARPARATIRAMRATLALAALAFTGCITHLPPLGTRHLDIHWRPGFAAAQAEATATRKPLLVLLVAGELAGPC